MKTHIIPLVVLQHAEEAAFLWLLRDHSTQSPHYTLVDLSHLDNRLEGHLDGLRIAGEQSWPFVWQQLEQFQEPGEVFAAACMGFELANQGYIKQLLDIAASDPSLARAAGSALGWLADDQATIMIYSALASENPAVRQIGLAGASIRRVHPGNPLADALHDSDDRVRARALKAVGELGLAAELPLLVKQLHHAHLEVRYQAAWAATRLARRPDAIAELQSLALTESTFRRQATEWAVRGIASTSVHPWIALLESLPGCERIAIHGAGASGDSVTIPKLIEKMAVPELARVAGEAFSMITGVDIAYLDLDTDQPEGFAAGPTENPDDARVEMDPDEDLPWPDPSKILDWWKSNQTLFTRGQRYLVGRAITPEWCREVLRTGYQRQRAAAAMELALANPEQPLFEVRAPGFRQAQQLAQ